GNITIPPQATITLTPPAPSGITIAPTAPTARGCTYTSCEEIKSHISKGCTFRDYLLKCGNQSPTPTLQAAPKYNP
ncbi:MAG TPA: hypothetical protein VK338_01865, partial [Candidatus Nitrosocosmicus sp.]|nr:hypothetical protein [Candidatus Nitrosocosmicus sp.]